MIPSAIAATPDALLHEGRLGALPPAAGDILGLADQSVGADAHIVEEELAGR